MGDRRVEYTYDAQGRVWVCSIFYGDEVEASYQYVYGYYDNSNNLRTVTLYTPTKIIMYSYTYNTHNQVTQIEKSTTDRTTPSETTPSENVPT